jgi:carbamoyltransferase
VSHIDGTTRPQTIDRAGDTAIGSILRALERRGSPPVLLNTSFNDRAQPIVNDARDALDALIALDLAFLVVDGQIVRKRGARRLTIRPPRPKVAL